VHGRQHFSRLQRPVHNQTLDLQTDQFIDKKTSGELNEAMVSISGILNKHRQGKIYFGLKNDGTSIRFTITDSTLRDVSRKIFGSGIRKIYSLCNTAGVEIKYENTDTDFKIEFSRIDRNKSPLSGHENGRINDQFRSYNSMDSCDSPEALPDCDQIILSCGRTGNRSGQAAEKLAAMGHTNTYELGEQNLGEIILAKKGFARDNPALPEVDSSRPAVVKSGKISIERL
jgi:rhodanese-related sulfurtransferase